MKTNISSGAQKDALDTAIGCITGNVKPRASERDLLVQRLQFIRMRIERAEQRAPAPVRMTMDEAIHHIERLLAIDLMTDEKQAAQAFVESWKRGVE